MTKVSRLAVLLLTLATPGSVSAQELPVAPYARNVSQLPTARVEFAVLADTNFGVGFFAAPSMRTVQRDSLRMVAIWFDPDSLQHWLDTAPAWVSKSATTGYPLPSILWTPGLVSTGKDGLGRPQTGERMPAGSTTSPSVHAPPAGRHSSPPMSSPRCSCCSIRPVPRRD